MPLEGLGGPWVGLQFESWDVRALGSLGKEALSEAQRPVLVVGTCYSAQREQGGCGPEPN